MLWSWVCSDLFRCVAQKHNQQKLAEAFESSQDVFLIFSVNQSSHFQGYARMTSGSCSNQVHPASVSSANHMQCEPVFNNSRQVCLASHVRFLSFVDSKAHKIPPTYLCDTMHVHNDAELLKQSAPATTQKPSVPV